MEIFHEYPALVPVTAGVLTEAGKLVKTFVKKQYLETDDLLQSGGIPSGHTVFVSALMTTVFLTDGPHSTFFAIAVTLAVVVMYDAMKLRRAAGRHAAELNRLIGEKKFQERLGHTPIEVLTGLLVGFVIAFLLLSFSFTYE